MVAANKCSSYSVSAGSVNRQFYSNRFTVMMLYVDDIPIFIYFDRLFFTETPKRKVSRNTCSYRLFERCYIYF